VTKQKLKFLLVLKSHPLSAENHTAYQIACAILSTQQHLLGVFFHESGVYSAEKNQRFPSDEKNPFKLWQALHENNNIPLWVCHAEIEKRGVSLAAPFEISRLSRLVELSEQADRVLTF
jgi:tRNA 2-thiouridine synthesizing protein D